MQKPLDTAPTDRALTPYDREHAVTYMRLLDADAEGADWREVAEIVLHIDPRHEPERARRAYETHLARAQWMVGQGYPASVAERLAQRELTLQLRRTDARHLSDRRARMKFRVPEVVIGCLLTFAAFAVGMAFTPSGRAGEPLLSWFTKDASGFFTALQFIVATGQAALFIYQLRLIRVSLDDANVVSSAVTRQASVAEDTLNKIERPYVFVFNVRSLKVVRWEDYEDGSSGARLCVTYSVANFGKLPAVIEDMQVSLSVHTEPLPPVNYDFNHPLAVSAVLVPGEPRNDLDEGLLWDDVAYDDYQGDKPDLGGKDLFFWVVIRYRGTFTRGHVTRACWRYDERTGRFVEFNGGREHNSQT